MSVSVITVDHAVTLYICCMNVSFITVGHKRRSLKMTLNDVLTHPHILCAYVLEVPLYVQFYGLCGRQTTTLSNIFSVPFGNGRT